MTDQILFRDFTFIVARDFAYAHTGSTGEPTAVVRADGMWLVLRSEMVCALDSRDMTTIDARQRLGRPRRKRPSERGAA